MIISHRNRFIFIKTRKTAGTSIEIALSQFCGPEDVITRISKDDELIRMSLGYLGPQNYKDPTQYLNLKYWRRFLKRKNGKNSTGQHGSSSFIKKYIGENIWNGYYKFCFERNPFDKAISHYYWAARKLSSPPEINDFLQTYPRYLLSNWSIYTIEDKIAVDHIGKYESMDEDLKLIFRKLGLPYCILPNTKGYARKNRQHYSQVLNEKSRHLIEEICAKEIENFGYDWVKLEET